mgnify:CR=1 FL=1
MDFFVFGHRRKVLIGIFLRRKTSFVSNMEIKMRRSVEKMQSDAKPGVSNTACDHVWEFRKTLGYWCHYEYLRCTQCGVVRDVEEFDASGYGVGSASQSIQKMLGVEKATKKENE